jgi:hypothetical protein
MECTRCESAEVATLRGDEALCAECAQARDWQDLIAIVQDAHVESPIAGERPIARSA